MKGLQLLATGGALPSRVVTNEDLRRQVDTSDEWITTRTGIRQRYYCTENEDAATLAITAARQALTHSGLTANDIACCIVATLSAPTATPSVACRVQAALGLPENRPAFDVNAACSGFLFALNTADAYLETGMAKTVLVIGSETLSREVDWSDRSTCILFGDGAGAAILRKVEGKGGILASVTGSDGTQGEVLTCKGRGIQNPFYKSRRKKDYIQMNGQAVFRFAVTTVPKYIKQILKKTNTEADEIKYFVLHQANRRILELIAKRLKVDMDKIPMNLDHYGNTSSASIPILLDELNKNNLLEAGDKLILSGFGGGLTWGAVLLEW